MSNRGLFLLESKGWCLAAAGGDNPTFHNLACSADVEPDDLAQAVLVFANQHDWPGRDIVIGVGSQSALAASFPAQAEDQRNRSALKYELESFLPYPAEEIVADYVLGDDTVLGVCVRIDTWLPLIVELELRGLRVQSVAPVALLAYQSYLSQTAGDGMQCTLWADNGSYELVISRGPRLVRWSHWAEDPSGAARQLAVESLHHSGALRFELVNADETLVEQLPSIEFQRAETDSMPLHALRTATAVLDGLQPVIELRREELTAGDPHRAVRGPLFQLAAAAVMLLLALASVLWVKAYQYGQISAELQRQQVAIFREAFPESRVPAAVLARLRSEQAKLEGARSGKSSVDLPVSALRVLFEFLAALPVDQRYRFRELRIEDGRLDADVELLSHNDANLLVDAFEQQGFSVTAPTSVQDGPGQVSSRIFADFRPGDRNQDQD